MVVDVWRNVSLGVREEDALVAVPTPKAPEGTAFPPRRLTFQGVPLFELGLWCGTCPALFTKLNEPQSADVGPANERLNVGLRAIDDGVLRAYGKVLPESTYAVLLLEITPVFVTPGDASDYFTHEQVSTWGLDPVVGSPENPGTPYYRSFETVVGRGRHLYEFVVPMVPPDWNDSRRTAQYVEDPGPVPGTAVAYSLLDVVQPAVDEGDDYYEHWVLSHFLLDGHHKMQAAAAAGRSIRILSLVDERVSIASPDDLSTMVRTRANPRRARADRGS